jgi:hypothetical protein
MMKGVQAFAYPRTRGYQGRVWDPWAQKTLTAWFGLANYGTRAAAERECKRWVRAMHRAIGKPLSGRTVVMCPSRGDQSTEVPGIRRTARGFEVTWAPRRGQTSRTHVSIKEWGEETAWLLALQRLGEARAALEDRT